MINNTKNILTDTKFENGFKLKGLSSLSNGHKPVREYKFNGKDPVWFLCQWNSKFNLSDSEFRESDGSYEISDISKKFTVGNDGRAVFELSAEREYTAPRKENEGWPHLLIEQEILRDNEIKDIAELRLKGKFELCRFQDHMGPVAKEHHTAQFVWVVVLKNGNENSSDFGHFVWVVICLYDTRYDFAPLFCQQDKALPDGEFIYSFSGRDYMKSPMKNGGEVEIDFDIYPRIPEILRSAKKAGFLSDTEKDDLFVSSTNMGFEITGTFDAQISARDIGIFVRKKGCGK